MGATATARAVLAVLALALVPTACSAGSAPVSGSAAPTASAPTPAAPPTTGGPSPGALTVPTALDFRGTTVDGQPFDGAALAGAPVMVWFWAPF